MYEIARNRTGLLDGRKPVSTESEARVIARNLAQEQGEAFQVWDETRLIDVIGCDDLPANAELRPTCAASSRKVAP